MENHQISTTLQMQPTTSNAIIQTNQTNTHTHKPISLKSDPSTTENLTKHTLIGKLISAKDINYNRIIAIIQKAWKHAHGLSIASLGQNTFLFKFTTENDLLQTISSSPWNIEGKHLILKHWIPGIPPLDLDFSTTTFWIQVHNLPIDYMTTENAKLISAHLGTLHKIDLNEKGSISVGKYLRIRVEIEAYAPLKCGFLMDQSPLSDTWFDFKYERLSDFCFHYGRLGHLKTECHFEPPSEQALKWDIGPKGYGPWLQADPSEQKASRLKEIISGSRSTSHDYDARASQAAAQSSQNHLLRGTNLHQLHKASPSSLQNTPSNPRSELLHPHQTPPPSPQYTLPITESQIFVPTSQTSTQIANKNHQNPNQAAISPPQTIKATDLHITATHTHPQNPTIKTTDLLLTATHTHPQNPNHDSFYSPLAATTTAKTGEPSDQQSKAASHAIPDLETPTNYSDTKHLSNLPTYSPLMTTDSAKTHLMLEIPHKSNLYPHLAHTTHPILSEDPNHTLTEAFVLFKMSQEHFKSLAETSLGSNRVHDSPWAKPNLNGPKSCRLNLLDNNPTSPTPHDKPNISIPGRKRKSEPTQSEITKKIKLYPSDSNTITPPFTHLRPTIAKKEKKTQSLGQIPTHHNSDRTSPLHHAH
jgi:hypothetical protein